MARTSVLASLPGQHRVRGENSRPKRPIREKRGYVWLVLGTKCKSRVESGGGGVKKGGGGGKEGLKKKGTDQIAGLIRLVEVEELAPKHPGFKPRGRGLNVKKRPERAQGETATEGCVGEDLGL